MNRIRLSEGELHSMLKEIVVEAINELHPITYANVARARKNQVDAMRDSEWDKDYEGAMKRQRDLFRKADRARDMARQAWNRDYGYDRRNPYDKPYWGRNGIHDFYRMDPSRGINDYPTVRGHYDDTQNDRYGKMKVDAENKYYYPQSNQMDTTTHRSNVSSERYNPLQDPDSLEGDRAAYYMQHGGAPYEKGKGYKI